MIIANGDLHITICSTLLHTLRHRHTCTHSITHTHSCTYGRRKETTVCLTHMVYVDTERLLLLLTDEQWIYFNLVSGKTSFTQHKLGKTSSLISQCCILFISIPQKCSALSFFVQYNQEKILLKFLLM